jgi:hypothetical protein
MRGEDILTIEDEIDKDFVCIEATPAKDQPRIPRLSEESIAKPADVAMFAIL